MKHDIRMPIAMGAMLSFMTPWMMHGDASAGVLFILAHVLVVGALLLMTIFIPAIRQKLAWVAHHRPRASHLVPMVGSFVFAWAMTCVFCLIVGGQHWT